MQNQSILVVTSHEYFENIQVRLAMYKKISAAAIKLLLEFKKSFKRLKSFPFSGKLSDDPNLRIKGFKK